MPSQRFYIWSMEADGSALAWRLKQEGYDVVLRIEELWMRGNLDGIVEKTNRRPRISDIVVFDSVRFGDTASELADDGFAVIGSSRLADELELDRAKTMAVLVNAGMQIPESINCETIEEAIQVVSHRGGQWVFKPSDNQDCASTYVAKDEADMIDMLRHFQSSLGDNIENIIQRKLEGVCISTEGWWDGEKWIEDAFNGTIEEKHLLAGNVGPHHGCSWNYVWGYEGVPLLAREMHFKITELLENDTYIGPIDFNAVVNEDGVFILELTPRFGYDAIEGLCAIMNCSLGEMLISLVEQDERWPMDTQNIGGALRIAIPPYPFAKDYHLADADIPIRFKYEDESNLWLTGVQYSKKSKKLVSAPTDGCIGIVSASEKKEEVWGLGHKLVSIAERLRIPDLMYRIDPGYKVSDQLFQLSSLGFVNPIDSTHMARSVLP